MNTLLQLLKQFEGLHRLGKDGLVYPYVCPAGVLTIGYGTTRFDKSTVPITKERAEEMLMEEALVTQHKVVRLCATIATDEYRLAAVTSWVYNLGIGAFRSSTMRRELLERDWEGAARECQKWVWGGGKRLPGLIIRRAVEADIIRKGHM